MVKRKTKHELQLEYAGVHQYHAEVNHRAFDRLMATYERTKNQDLVPMIAQAADQRSLHAKSARMFLFDSMRSKR